MDHTAVYVDFNVQVDASGNVDVFGAAPTLPNTNVVVAEYPLPVNALYKADASGNPKGLIEIWEPADDPNNVKCRLASTDSSDLSGAGGYDLSGAWVETTQVLSEHLHKALLRNLDCSGAAPFNDGRYTGLVQYTKVTDFGHLALGAFAHYMFGHVNATAAITNDRAFLMSMLSIDSAAAGANEAVVATDASGAEDRYAVTKAATKTRFATGYTHEAEAAWTTGSAADANLASQLVGAIVGKGLDANGALVMSDVNGATSATLSNIVRQVIGQDATRVMNEDNSERTYDLPQLLRFYEGDVIYVNIILKKPTVTVAAGQRGDLTGATLADSYAATAANEQNYTIKLTLGPAVV
jgi:hypothetical protein